MFALLGILVALVMGGALFVMGGSQEVADTEPLALPTKKAKLLETPTLAKKTAAAANARVRKVSRAPVAAKPQVAAAKPKVAPKPAAKPAKKSVPAVAKNGLPTSIVRALAAN